MEELRNPIPRNRNNTTNARMYLLTRAFETQHTYLHRVIQIVTVLSTNHRKVGRRQIPLHDFFAALHRHSSNPHHTERMQSARVGLYGSLSPGRVLKSVGQGRPGPVYSAVHLSGQGNASMRYLTAKFG